MGFYFFNLWASLSQEFSSAVPGLAVGLGICWARQPAQCRCNQVDTSACNTCRDYVQRGRSGTVWGGGPAARAAALGSLGPRGTAASDSGRQEVSHACRGAPTNSLTIHVPCLALNSPSSIRREEHEMVIALGGCYLPAPRKALDRGRQSRHGHQSLPLSICRSQIIRSSSKPGLSDGECDREHARE